MSSYAVKRSQFNNMSTISSAVFVKGACPALSYSPLRNAYNKLERNDSPNDIVTAVHISPHRSIGEAKIKKHPCRSVFGSLELRCLVSALFEAMMPLCHFDDFQMRHSEVQSSCVSRSVLQKMGLLLVTKVGAGL